MPIVPIRGLAAKGILRDPAPYELDLDAWSGGLNVRFHANYAERAPVFRNVYTLTDEPVMCVGLEPSTGYDSIIVVGGDGRVFQYTSGSLVEVTETGHTANTDPRSYTTTFLGDILYINRPDQAPRYFTPTSTHVAAMPNMECAWTCRSLRAFGDYLIALNVTKPGTYTDPYTSISMTGGSFPTMFKWSDLVAFGTTPDSWDPEDPTKSTGENILEELNSPIVDGGPMRNLFVIYSETQIWAAAQTDDELIFSFTKLFNEGGLIAPNCWVEVDGVHYVFGVNDIYKHDGVTKVSLVDKRNRETIFRNLNVAKAEGCFVAYAPALDSIFFGYNSGDPTATFPGLQCDRCNMAAVYDLSADTWSFIDLPNVSAITQANIDNGLTYAACDGLPQDTYAQIGGSYYDQDNSYIKNTVACSGAVSGVITANRILGYDFMNLGSMSFPYLAEVNGPAYLERIGIALDQVGSDLQTYKKCRRVFPLINAPGSVPVQIQIGGAETPASLPNYTQMVSFDPSQQYKIDVMKGGRYLAMRFTVSTAADFQVAGLDLDVTNAGRR